MSFTLSDVECKGSHMELIFRTSLLLFLFSSACLSGVQSMVYMVQLQDSSAVHYTGSIEGYEATAPSTLRTRIDGSSSGVQNYAEYLRRTQDNLLATTFPEGDYTKLYSYYFVVNGFAVDFKDGKQAEQLIKDPRVKHVEADKLVRTATTHTPDYLELPNGAWAENGGKSSAGEDIVIGFIDTGVNPFHPSFANDQDHPYGPLESYTGSCEVAEEFPEGSCNYKLIGARHFSAAAEAAGVFNATIDFASPLDGNGHGTHTSSTAGGNYGVPVVVGGVNFGRASGIAPRARIAMYKALYRQAGGFFADVVAAIDQAAADGVDILSLSIAASDRGPLDAVYISTFDIALLGAVKAGVFVTQAAGNYGPFEKSILSFSPWIVTAAAGHDDRNYSNSITLGNGKTLTGFGLANRTEGDEFYTIVLSTDVTVTTDPIIPVEDCQRSELFSKTLVEGRLLVCRFTAEFIYGSATIKAVSETAKNLSAAGFVLVVPYDMDMDTYFDSAAQVIVQGVPAILLGSFETATEFWNYLNSTNSEAKAKLNGGFEAVYNGVAPIVAFFSSRGPDYDDLNLQPNDVLKPNVLAPGVKIWAGWSPIGVDQRGVYEGEIFAMDSGTSMATPHVAGVAALVKQKNPSFSPAAIHSALASTAFNKDKYGVVLQADFGFGMVQPASPFDMGAGHVNATAALDPGLIFEAGFDDYVEFLCHIPTLNSSEVRNATGSGCENVGEGYASDLNTPYIAIGLLEGFRAVTRIVTSVAASEEWYTVAVDSPSDVTSTVTPTSFSVAPGKSQSISLTFQSNTNSTSNTFGALHFRGTAGHFITIPITVSVKRTKI